jgi:hypothetical protein
MEKGRLHFRDNPAFMRYVEELPDRRTRILLVPGDKPGDDRYLVAVREGDGPPTCDSSDKENK